MGLSYEMFFSLKHGKNIFPFAALSPGQLGKLVIQEIVY